MPQDSSRNPPCPIFGPAPSDLKWASAESPTLHTQISSRMPHLKQSHRLKSGTPSRKTVILSEGLSPQSKDPDGTGPTTVARTFQPQTRFGTSPLPLPLSFSLFLSTPKTTKPAPPLAKSVARYHSQSVIIEVEQPVGRSVLQELITPFIARIYPQSFSFDDFARRPKDICNITRNFAKKGRGGACHKPIDINPHLTA